MTRNNSNFLETKWERIARTFSRNRGVTVRLTGNRCSADMTRGIIYIPANADEYQGLDGHILEGLVDHEWKHLEVEQAAKAAGRTLPSSVWQGLTAPERTCVNLFEDYRIDTQLGREYVGCGQNIDISNDYLANVHRRRVQAGNKSAMMDLVVGILESLAGKPIDWLPVETQVALAKTAHVWKKAAELKSFEEAVNLGKEMVVALESMSEGQAPQQPKQEGKSQQRKQDNKKESKQPESDKDQDGDEDQDGAGGGDSESDEGEDQDGDEDQDGAGGGDSDDGTDDSEQNTTGAGQGHDPDGKADVPAYVEKALEDEAIDLKESLRTAVEGAAIQYNQTSTRYSIHPKCAADYHDVAQTDNSAVRRYKVAMADMGGITNTLKSKLITLLRAKTVREATLDRERGSIDNSALHRLRVGDKNLFIEPGAVVSLDTCVSFLVDLSGSMRTGGGNGMNRLDLAKRAMAVCGDALDKLGIPTEMWGFANEERSTMTYKEWMDFVAGIRAKGETGRVLPMVYTQFKLFGESWQRRKVSLLDPRVEPGGNNCDHEAIIMAAKRIMARPEKRKILIVLSDGRPNLDCGLDMNGVIARELERTVQKVEQAGIQVIGVGMNTDVVKKFYKHNLVISQMKELPQRLVGLLKSLLV